MGKNRYGYPFGDELDSDYTRHHIIPMQQLVDAFKEWFSKSEGIREFLKNLNPEALTSANLGSWKKKGDKLSEAQLGGLIEAQRQENREAEGVLKELAAWLPGNLVIGPRERQGDPRESFDDEALGYRILADDSTYSGLKEEWGKAKNDQEAKDKILKKLLPKPMLDASAEWKPTRDEQPPKEPKPPANGDGNDSSPTGGENEGDDEGGASGDPLGGGVVEPREGGEEGGGEPPVVEGGDPGGRGTEPEHGGGPERGGEHGP